jgi:hypothetical protein
MKHYLVFILLCLVSQTFEKRINGKRINGSSFVDKSKWKNSEWWKMLKSQYMKLAKKKFNRKYSKEPEIMGKMVAAYNEWITCGTVKGKKCISYMVVPIPKGCAVLYEKCNFKGWKVLVCHSVSNLGKDRNNKVSSIKVGKGTRATLFEGMNFGGRSFSAEKKVSCLIKYNFNDISASLQLKSKWK